MTILLSSRHLTSPRLSPLSAPHSGESDPNILAISRSWRPRRGGDNSPSHPKLSCSTGAKTIVVLYTGPIGGRLSFHLNPVLYYSFLHQQPDLWIMLERFCSANQLHIYLPSTHREVMTQAPSKRRSPTELVLCSTTVWTQTWLLVAEHWSFSVSQGLLLTELYWM